MPSRPAEIAAGSAYLPASMMQGFGAKVGDRIHIATARNGARHPLFVAGFFEDPIAGSTMIGMKRFLIGADGTRRSDADFIKHVNERSALPRFAEQVHSRTVMADFMLLLQDSFTAIFASFVLVLLFVILLVLVHTVRSDIKADWKDMGILKELGFTSRGIASVFCNALHQHGFQLHLAFRQVLSKKSAYADVLAVSFFLALFSSMTARLDSWLGKNGEGLMDAFNPADHHLGVQGFGAATMEDFERVTGNYSEIPGRYVIAMPVLRLNGTDYKAHVLPRRITSISCAEGRAGRTRCCSRNFCFLIWGFPSATAWRFPHGAEARALSSAERTSARMTWARISA